MATNHSKDDCPDGAKAQSPQEAPRQKSENPEDEKQVRRVAVRKPNRQETQDRIFKEKLLDLAAEVVTTGEQKASFMKRRSPEYVNSAKGYRKLLEKAKTAAAFRQSVNSTFVAHRSEILAENVDGAWLSKAPIPITWIIVPLPPARPEEYRPYFLDLSKGFRSALSVAEHIEGEDKTISKIPEQFLCKLYQVFKEVVVEKEDKAAVDDAIEALQSVLAPKEGGNIGSLMGSLNPESVQSLVGVALEAVKSFGLDVGGLNAEEVAERVSSVAQNPKLGQIMSNLGRDLQGCKNPKDVVEVFAQRAAPGTREEIGSVMGEIKDDFARVKPHSEVKQIEDGKE